MDDERLIPMKETGMSKFEYHKRLVSDRRLTGEGRLRVLLAMWDYSDKDGRRIRPGRARLMRHTNLKSSATDSALKFLVANGYLVVQNEGGRGRGGRGLATVYELGVPGYWPREIDADGQSRDENTPSWREVFRKETSRRDGTFEQETSRRDEETSRHDGQNPPPRRDPSDLYQNYSHHHPGFSEGAPPPAFEGASNSPHPDADGNAQDWGLSGSASYDWGTQDDTQPNPSGQGWEPAKDTAPEPADPPTPSAPSHDASGSDQIGTGRRALQELLAQRRTNNTQEATP